MLLSVCSVFIGFVKEEREKKQTDSQGKLDNSSFGSSNDGKAHCYAIGLVMLLLV